MSIQASRFIVVAGHVEADGLGDYFHCLEAAKILAKAFNEYSVKLVCSVARLDENKRTFEVHPEIGTFFDDAVKSEEYQKTTSKISEIIRSAVVVVGGPSIGCTFVNFESLKCPCFRYNEYGFYHLATGLGERDFGIVIKDPPEKQELSLLKDTVLAQFLNPQADLCYGYLKTNTALLDCHLQGYILACSAMHETSEKPLDIICPLTMIAEKNWAKHIKEKIAEIGLGAISLFGGHKDFDISRFAALGVGKLELYKKNKEGNLENVETIEIKKEGKTVRLINPFPLSQSDVLLLNSLSSFTGATGDMSITEAISCSKPFFYQILEHKKTFFASLHQLVKQHFQENSSIVGVFDCLLNLSPTLMAYDLDLGVQLGRLLAQPETGSQFEQLSRIIRENHSFNKYLVEKVQGMLLDPANFRK